MSRSYREPYYVSGSGSKSKSFAKKKANKKVRKANVADGSSFKKISESYDITDYKYKWDKKCSDPEWKAKRK